MTTVTEIAPDLFRISTFAPAYGIQFNQFLIRDEEPFLMHTGLRGIFADTFAAVRRLIDPARLSFVGASHFESDECGALNLWLEEAPRAQALAGEVCVTVNLADFADRPARALADGEEVSLGEHKLTYLATPHLPHGWDAGLFFDSTTGALLCSDLFFQPGDPAPLEEHDVVGPAREAIRAGKTGPLANDMPYTPQTEPTFRRLAALAPRTLAVMHGSSFSGDGGRALAALAEIVRAELGGSAPPR